MEQTEATAIDVLELSTRANNTLRRNGITTITQLRNSLLILPLLNGCGVGVTNEILGSLAIYDDRNPA